MHRSSGGFRKVKPKRSASKRNTVPSNMFKRILKILAWISGLLLLLAVISLTSVDWSDYKEHEYYFQTMEALEDLEYAGGDSDHILAGWATVNATPREPLDLVGYKPRRKYEFVQDSTHIKALVLNNGRHAVVYLSYELLIIHPQLALRVEHKIKDQLRSEERRVGKECRARRW